MMDKFETNIRLHVGEIPLHGERLISCTIPESYTVRRVVHEVERVHGRKFRINKTEFGLLVLRTR